MDEIHRYNFVNIFNLSHLLHILKTFRNLLQQTNIFLDRIFIVFYKIYCLQFLSLVVEFCNYVKLALLSFFIDRFAQLCSIYIASEANILALKSPYIFDILVNFLTFVMSNLFYNVTSMSRANWLGTNNVLAFRWKLKSNGNNAKFHRLG